MERETIKRIVAMKEKQLISLNERRETKRTRNMMLQLKEIGI